MKNSDFNTKRNFSRAGKASAKTFSFVIDRSERLNKILKNKPHARYIEEDYFEKKDGLSLDDSKDLISEDIFDKDYKDHYKELLKLQKIKYFQSKKSCGFSKKIFSEYNNSDLNSIQIKKFKIIKDIKNKQKIIRLDQNPNKDYIYKKLIYSPSFGKMLGRYDLEIKKEEIEGKLERYKQELIKLKKEKKKPIKKVEKKEDNSDTKKNTKTTKNTKINSQNKIKALDMDKMLDRGLLSPYNDLKNKTSYEIRNKRKSPTFIKNFSSLSPFNEQRQFSLRNIKKSPTIRDVSKSSLLIKDDKNLMHDKIGQISKRIFSGLSSKNVHLKKEDSSLSNNIFFDNSFKKEINFTPKFKFRKRNFSSNSFNNNIKKNIFSAKSNSFTFNSKSKTHLNFYENKKKKKNNYLISPKLQSLNKTFSFKKMLSREYVNRIQINNKIGANLPLKPNYSSIYPKIIMSVKFSNLNNIRKKPPIRDLIGVNIEEKKVENDATLNINFTKMFGRGKSNTDFPIFMNNLNSRCSFELLTAKSLEMNHFSKRSFNYFTPASSFSVKKSFNTNISNNNLNNKPNSIKNLKENKEKDIRIANYNSNIENIFKKVIYDDIIDKNDIKENTFDIKKNPKLKKAINLSYKNLMSDYYKLNLDYIERNINKKKIDGITYQEFKGNNDIKLKYKFNPLKINESDIKI